LKLNNIENMTKGLLLSAGGVHTHNEMEGTEWHDVAAEKWP